MQLGLHHPFYLVVTLFTFRAFIALCAFRNLLARLSVIYGTASTSGGGVGERRSRIFVLAPTSRQLHSRLGTSRRRQLFKGFTAFTAPAR
jgi:hypothetical protein